MFIKNIAPDTKGQIIWLLKSYFFRVMQGILFWLPVKKNRIMVYVHSRKGFACNPKYIVKKLQELYGNKLEIIWTTMYPDSCQEIEDMGMAVMTAHSRGSMVAYLRTRIYITNDAFPSWTRHRSNQIWINTWHGGMNYKHIGYDYLSLKSKWEKRLFRLENREPDIYLSGSEFFTENTSDSFRMSPHIFLHTGLPRNDIFFHNDENLRKEVRTRLGINEGCKIVLYAPTFRKDTNRKINGPDSEILLRTLEQRFGGSWIILFRNHCFVKKRMVETGRAIIDVSDYPDMQELLYISDVLISDYSSCMWDFCLTKRPCFVFAEDIYDYAESDRAFAYPIEKWPYAIAQTNAELTENILAYDQVQYCERVTEHLAEAGCYDKGNASQAVAQIIERYCLE